MGFKSGLTKKLLLAASILGVAQGLITFIGGITTCFDRDKNVIFKSYCSSIEGLSTVAEFRNIPCTISRVLQDNAVHKEGVDAILLGRIEVGLRDSISIASLLKI